MKATIALCLGAIVVVAVSSAQVNHKSDAEWRSFKVSNGISCILKMF